MGPFCVTRSNTTHQLTDPTQPSTSENIGSNPTRRNTTNKLTVWYNQTLSNRALNALTQSFQNFSPFAIVDPTQHNPPKSEKSPPNLTQRNVTQPNPWVNSTNGQLWVN